jgi:polynucleotide 5'-kinase involved in rRNA processing
MYISIMTAGGLTKDIYALHQMVAGIDARALWQHRGNKVILLSETKLQNSVEAQTKFNEAEVIPFTFRCRASKRHFDNVKNKRVETFCPTPQMIPKIDVWAETNGFKIVQARYINEKPYSLSKTNAYLTSLYVVGDLRVVDPEKFANALVSGVGGGKRLGFGMLNIWN